MTDEEWDRRYTTMLMDTDALAKIGRSHEPSAALTILGAVIAMILRQDVRDDEVREQMLRKVIREIEAHARLPRLEEPSVLESFVASRLRQ